VNFKGSFLLKINNVKDVMMKMESRISLTNLNDVIDKFIKKINKIESPYDSKYPMKEIESDYNSIKALLYQEIHNIMDKNTYDIFEIMIQLTRNKNWLSKNLLIKTVKEEIKYSESEIENAIDKLKDLNIIRDAIEIIA
jgi:hypothetical protein